MSALSVRPAGLQPEHEIELTATRVCGHLYHQICLGNWFDRQEIPVRHCPKCNALLAEGDTITVRPCGDGDEDEDRNRAEALRANEQVQILQEEANQMHTLLTETLDKAGIEATQNDFLSRELEKLAAQNVKLQRNNEETVDLLKVNEDSFRTEIQKLGRERQALEDNLGFVETSGVRQKTDLETQLQSKQQRIRELEADANELRKSNDYWRREHNLIRRRHGHIDDDDEFMINKITQTENPEMVNLDERVRRLKQCVQVMESEWKLMENMSLKAAVSAPCPVGQQRQQMPVSVSADDPTAVGFFSRLSKNGHDPVPAARASKNAGNDPKRDNEDYGPSRKISNGAGDSSKFDWYGMAERHNNEKRGIQNGNYSEMRSDDAKAISNQILNLRDRNTDGNGDGARRTLSPSATPFHPLTAAAHGFEGCNHFGNAKTGSQGQGPQGQQSGDVKLDNFDFLTPRLNELEVPDFD